jgi:hypothetical protein
VIESDCLLPRESDGEAVQRIFSRMSLTGGVWFPNSVYAGSPTNFAIFSEFADGRNYFAAREGGY